MIDPVLKKELDELDPEVTKVIEFQESDAPVVPGSNMPIEEIDPRFPVASPESELPPNWRETLKSWLG